MGLWDNIKSFVKRIFNPEQKTPKKTTERKISTEETGKPQTPEEPTTQPEELTKEEIEKIRELPQEILTTKGQEETQQILQKAKETKTITPKIYGKGITKTQIDDYLNQHPINTTNNKPIPVNEKTGQNYAKSLHQAVKGKIVDDEIAELVVLNAERFKPRFTTHIQFTFMDETGYRITNMQAIGSLIHEVDNYLEENGQPQPNENIAQYIKRIREGLLKGTSLGVTFEESHGLPSGNTIKKVTWQTSVTFN